MRWKRSGIDSIFAVSTGDFNNRIKELENIQRDNMNIFAFSSSNSEAFVFSLDRWSRYASLFDQK